MPLGPVEIEVIRNALTAAAAEMDATVWRTSRSTIVRELLDYSTAVFDAEGSNLAQSARIPSHLNSMSHLLRELLDRMVAAKQLSTADANLLAGHILLVTFGVLSAGLWTTKWYVVFLPLPAFGVVFFTAFEVMVAFLQAYVFTLLFGVYFGSAVSHEH